MVRQAMVRNEADNVSKIIEKGKWGRKKTKPGTMLCIKC